MVAMLVVVVDAIITAIGPATHLMAAPLTTTLAAMAATGL
jgi:hypothetical protein